jgi:ABC-type polysaccharide/polyol phosphate export permease
MTAGTSTLPLAAASRRRATAPRLFAAARELWAYRDLLLNLVRRDLAVRYKRTALGFLWSFLNPLLMMMVFAVVFMVVKPQEVGKYPLFVLTGILAWNFTASSLSGAARSITSNANLIDKIYFPREVLPLSVVLANLVNFVFSLAVFIPIALAFGVRFGWWALALPALIAVHLVLVSGLALIVAALNVYYRDTEAVLDVGLTAWFFLTPVFWQLELLPNQVLGIDVWRLEYTLNPMATLVTDYRYILLYHYPVIRHTLIALTLGLALLAGGWALFRRWAPRFSEEV